MGLNDLIGYGQAPASVNLGAKQGVFIGSLSLITATLWTDDPQFVRMFVCMGGGIFMLLVAAYLMHGALRKTSRSPIELIRGVDSQYVLQTSLLVFVVMYVAALVLTNLLIPGLLPGLMWNS